MQMSYLNSVEVAFRFDKISRVAVPKNFDFYMVAEWKTIILYPFLALVIILVIVFN